jgi:hypothetical protein
MMRSTTSLDDEERKLPKSGSFYLNMPPNYSLFGGTMVEEEKTVKPEAGEPLTFDDAECDRINLNDYLFFNTLYEKYEVNSLLKQVLENNNYTLTKTLSNGIIDLYHIYTHNETQQTVALFSVVKDREDKIFLKDNYIWSLVEALRVHHNNHERNDIIIVPLLETILPHFRLITLDLRKNSGLYHDSKSPLTSASLEITRALVSAATKELAAAAVNSDIHPVLLPNFGDSYFYVASSCGRFFYNIPVTENCLNHQAFYNRTDSGAYIVAYAELFLQGIDLKLPIKIDIDAKKEDHHKFLHPQPTLATEAKSEPARPTP